MQRAPTCSILLQEITASRIKSLRLVLTHYTELSCASCIVEAAAAVCTDLSLSGNIVGLHTMCLDLIGLLDHEIKNQHLMYLCARS